MKNYFLTIFILFALLLLPKAAFASCAVKPSVESEAKSASVVFVGTVTKITPAQIAIASYSIMAKKPKWEKDFGKVDLVTFSVSEAFKDVSSETIEVATSAEGDAGYTFEGGTWLKEGQTYLVYAYKRESSDAIPDDLTEEKYDKEIAAELRAIHKSFPKKLAAEINEFNSKISPYSAGFVEEPRTSTMQQRNLNKFARSFPEQNAFPLKPMPNKSM